MSNFKALALIIGIANYQYVRSLSSVVLNDAREIGKLLADEATCGYAPENVQLLLDQAATLAALRDALASLAARSDQSTTVLIYFSGHGGRIAAGPETGEYLLPVDANVSSPRALAASALSNKELTEALRAIHVPRLVVILDCCHAGGIGETKDAQAPPWKAGLSDDAYDALRTGRGRVIYASSSADELSWVLPGAFHSLFTQYLLEGLRGGIVSDDGVIRIFQVFDYVRPRVKQQQTNQTPVFKADIQDNFAIALYRGGVEHAAPKDVEGFMYDAYLVYADQEPDASFVWNTLEPRLTEAGLRVAVAHDVERPGVARIIAVEDVVKQAKRVVILLSPQYANDPIAAFTDTLTQSIDIQQRTHRLLPVMIQPTNRIRDGIEILERINLAHPHRSEREMQRLLDELKSPLSRRT